MPDPHGLLSQYTRVQHPPLVPELTLHLAGEITPLWQTIQALTGQADTPPPFWAVAWAGGQAVARFVLDHPAEVAGKRVVDFAAGSGLCAIAAARAGAAETLAADIDEFSEVAVAANSSINGMCVSFTASDLLDADPPLAADVILAGDIWYEQPLAHRVLTWLRAAHERGVRVLMGDPGRAHLPREELLLLAEYMVPTSRETEDAELKRTSVLTFYPRQ